MRTITLTDDDMREPCEHNNLAVCGHCNRSWCYTCNPTPSARCPFEYEHEYDDVEDEITAAFDNGKKFVTVKPPQVGDLVCDCRFKHLRIVAIDDDGDTVTLEDGHVCSFNHCCDPISHEYTHPCPICGEHGGFHDDNKHRGNIDPKYLLAKGWHLGH